MLSFASLADKLFVAAAVTSLAGACFYWLLVWRLAKLNVPVKLLAWPRDVHNVFKEYRSAVQSRGVSAWPLYCAMALLSAGLALVIATMIRVSSGK